MKFSIYRYHPEHDTAPSMQAMELADALIKPGMMLLDALLLLKAQDESLTFRRSCGEGVCGSDAMNINGRNGLAFITPLAELNPAVEVRPCRACRSSAISSSTSNSSTVSIAPSRPISSTTIRNPRSNDARPRGARTTRWPV